jgi:hypothetical protein
MLGALGLLANDLHLLRIIRQVPDDPHDVKLADDTTHIETIPMLTYTLLPLTECAAGLSIRKHARSCSVGGVSS